MIFNQTTGKIISRDEIICNTSFSRMRGLMFRKKQNCILIFPQERPISLHMFWVFYPIDVVIADKNGKVIEIKRNFRPFTIWKAKQKGKYVVELSELDSKVNLGNVIKLKIN